ncbi:MAG: helix-turn-helix domain-containing protein [Ignavibacteriae bacterium]|nr:helix-turn-helix domain-containing protein [Ignavibacteriota bacterium]
MEDLQKQIGMRLREVRNIFFEGGKLSTRQFAIAVNETKDNIANYENGRANVPNRLLVTLFNKGINPTYILTGNGSIYTSNEAGQLLAKRAGSKVIAEANVSEIYSIESKNLSFEEMVKQFGILTAAAGDMMKVIQKKTNEKK